MPPKKLVMITGPAGVGKSTTVRELFRLIDGSAWLDADWCWMLNPWHQKSAAQKQETEALFARILSNYLEDEATHTVFFSWVIRYPAMFDLVTERIDYPHLQLHKIALICDPEEHLRRLVQDRRSEASVQQREGMDAYLCLGAEVIDTTDLTPRQAALRLHALLEAKNG